MGKISPSLGAFFPGERMPERSGHLLYRNQAAVNVRLVNAPTRDRISVTESARFMV